MPDPRTLRMTPQARAVLDAIRAHIGEHGIAPSYREIADAVGLCSTSIVSRCLVQLEERGHLVRGANRSRAIELTDRQTFRLPADLTARLCADAKALARSPEQHLADAVRAFLPSPSTAARERDWRSSSTPF